MRADVTRTIWFERSTVTSSISAEALGAVVTWPTEAERIENTRCTAVLSELLPDRALALAACHFHEEFVH